MARQPRILDEPSPPPQPGQTPPGPRQRVPWVGWTIILSCVAMAFLAKGLPLVSSDPEAIELAQAGHPLALYGPLVQRGEYWRMLTCAFEHGGPLHLLFNMSVVYTLGFMLERAIGSWRFLGLSVVTCLGSSAFALFFNFNEFTVGASGMILGWAGAMVPIATRQGRKELGFWLVQIAVISALPSILDLPISISWAGHLGGFLFGLPCGIALRLGGPVYKRALPLILFITAVVAMFAAHPERRGGF
ncbi:rhomboid family intramembrane serine protease [Hyalangium rubrum]|uniref:Rhomboid family intramembrane serine protease n=1 Tax=Hyalangium rubrum TaxID=3103134 RepID=A0ABU5HBK2_9BACT|nr:rhomboid family intramembrane serine protease [Hyalangium sp. s54d21]MDY7229465.1 rhomboid family intramembrane serine protease [Hyalangium sp. s54d21]